MFSYTRLLKAGLFVSCFIAASSAHSLTSSSACSASSSSSSSSVAPVSQLSCGVVVTNQWQGGYQVDVKITNGGTTTTKNWSVIVDVPVGDTLNSAWNAAKIAQTGNSYTYDSLGWNGTLVSKASATFGVSLSRPAGASALPTCRIATGTNNNAPTADFTTAVINDTVHVQTINAVDIDGDKLTYAIDFGDGKTINYNDVWHTYKTPGTYTITQKVSDGKVSSVVTHDVTVTAAGVNRAPSAVIAYRVDRYKVYADAKTSADRDNNPLTYTWDFGSGPSATTTTTSTTSTTAGKGWSYVTLTVFDGQIGNTVQYSIYSSDCYVSYPFPTGIFSHSLNGSTIAVDASASRVVDDFSWDFGDGATATGMFATHTYTRPGSYAVKLTTTNFGRRNVETTVITIDGAVGGLPPVIGTLNCDGFFVNDSRPPLQGTVFTTGCHTEDSFDPEGGPLIYQVYWGEGSLIDTYSYPSFRHDYRNLNTNVTIKVSLSDGTHTTEKEFPFYTGTPLTKNLPPVVDVKCTESLMIADDFTNGVAFYNYTTRCDASASSDPEGQALNYTMSWGDATTAPSSNGVLYHNYSVGGAYNLTLEVSDGFNTTTKTIPWVASDSYNTNTPPVACFRFYQTANIGPAYTGAMASCTTDADGDALTYTWDFGDGTTGTGVNVSHTYTVAGTYVVTLTVSDGVDTSTISQTFVYAGVPKTSHCEFKITSEWASGFSGWLRVYNDTTAPINNWFVQATFAGASRVSSFWNGTVTGTSRYVVTSVPWNDTIKPGGFSEVGFQVSNNGAPNSLPILGGTFCQ